MRYIFLLLLTLISLLSYGQITMTKEKVYGSIIYDIDSMSAEKIYNKVLAYIQATYPTPDKVLKAKIPNEMVRMEGVFGSPVAGASFISMENLDLFYSLVIEVKDNKMRITVTGMQYSFSSGHNYYHFDFVFNKDGSVKEKRAKYKQLIEETYTVLVNNIYQYVIAKSDW